MTEIGSVVVVIIELGHINAAKATVTSDSLLIGVIFDNLLVLDTFGNELIRRVSIIQLIDSSA